MPIDPETLTALRKLREEVEEVRGILQRKTGSNSATIRGTIVEGSKITATNIINTSNITNDAIDKDKLDFEVVRVTVSVNDSAGTGSATSGSVIIGFIPISGFSSLENRAVIESISISSTTITVTTHQNVTTTDLVADIILIKA